MKITRGALAALILAAGLAACTTAQLAWCDNHNCESTFP